MKLFIKNMVCNRCLQAVSSVLESEALQADEMRLGEAIIKNDTLLKSQRFSLEEKLKALGFELLDDRKSQTINRLKAAVIQLIHHKQEIQPLKHSEYLAAQLNIGYSTLSRLFSEVEGITIEQYILLQKVEKVKELLCYDEKNITEIALDMGYSSTAHLSAQFKKVTGMTPTAFKKLKAPSRIPLDEI